MDLQTLSDRAEIIDLISAYNKASFYCDAIAAEYRQRTGLQHLCLDSETDVINTVAAAFQRGAPASNPLPSGTARALAYVLTHDQVFGADVEDNFRAAGWNGPPTVTRAGGRQTAVI